MWRVAQIRCTIARKGNFGDATDKFERIPTIDYGIKYRGWVNPERTRISLVLSFAVPRPAAHA